MTKRHTRRYFLPELASLLLALFLFSCSGRHNIYFENDIFAPGGRDKNYTNGVEYEYAPDEEHTVAVGQVFYTPDDLRTAEPIPDDRPYAGQLYVAGKIHTVHHYASGRDSKETIGLKVGCVGECSFAEEVQKFVHIDLDMGADPAGWHNQIDTELTLAASYEHAWRVYSHKWANDMGVDAPLTPRAQVGNDITRASVEQMLRFGFRLPQDYGPNTINPTAELGASATEPFRAYVYGKADGKFTAYNIFIDNHLFNSGTDHELEEWGGDLGTGIMLHYRGFRLGFQFIWRHGEYKGDSTHKFGSVTLGFEA